MTTFLKLLRFMVCLTVAVLLSGCNLIGSMGYLYQEKDHIVDDPQFPARRWNTVISPKASAVYARLAELDFIRAFVAVRDDTLIAEWYDAGFGPETAFNMKSASKSVLSALIGIAIEEGLFKSVHQPLIEIIPEHFPPDDPEKAAITLEHLITMSAGFAYDENRDNDVYASRNWTRRILELPLNDEPGSAYNYGTIQTHLLSAALTRASGMSSLNFAQRNLFDPMRISIRRWKKSPEGVFFGGSNLYMTARDMAAFGHLYVQEGQLDGVQLLSSTWIDRSLSPHFENIRDGVDYAYLWYLKSLDGEPIFYAEGYGHQLIVNFPGLNATMVLTCSTPYRYEWSRREDAVWSFLQNEALPLIRHP